MSAPRAASWGPSSFSGGFSFPAPGQHEGMRQTALRALVSAVVVGSVVVLALALWKLKLILALLFLGFIVAAAMRPGIEGLRSRGVPRVVGILLHYAVILGLIAALLWAVVPRALDQVQTALGDLPQTRSDLRQEARDSSGLRSEILLGIEQRLERLPRVESLVDEGDEVRSEEHTSELQSPCIYVYRLLL